MHLPMTVLCSFIFSSTSYISAFLVMLASAVFSAAPLAVAQLYGHRPHSTTDLTLYVYLQGKDMQPGVHPQKDSNKHSKVITAAAFALAAVVFAKAS